MSRPVAIVTDSTAYLPAGLAESLGVQVVALRVQLGSRSGLDGVDVSPADVTEALLAREVVTTSRPSPADFEAAYQRAIDGGACAVVSVHLAAALSGTYDAALLAAADFGSQVTVVDSGSAAMGMGFAVLAAARTAEAGAELATVLVTLDQSLQHSSVFFYVDSLEWLRRGGRIGPAAAWLGTALAVKPIVQLRDGQLVPLEKVRTRSRALSRLVQLASAAAGERVVDVAVQHLASPDRAAQVAELLRDGMPALGELHICEVSAVVGAHVGPGVIGVAISSAGRS